MADQDAKNKDIEKQLPPYLGGKLPSTARFMINSQIDLNVWRELINFYYVEYWNAAERAKAEGDDRRATFYKGMANGFFISYNETYQLERFGVD